ncbi:isthmin-1 isoform X4 [Orcinus orca]|uniref:isthmin-1 isoform X4 n=1 Tax=Orcinus orca TaxID=9733 RepID=UPI002110EC37|nr:isthmin-1 isoform X4 [Orcinus orca]
MVRLAAELLLLLGLLLLTLHITVLRGSGAADGPTAANASRTQLQNNLNMESASTSETSSPLSKETPGEHSDHQSAHQPFPRQQFQQEAGPPSLQRDGPRSFLLDLPNFPDLSKADINGQNPNIQIPQTVRETGVSGLFAVSPVGTATRNGPGLVAMRALQPNLGRVTVQTAQGYEEGRRGRRERRGGRICNQDRIEDTFRTAATEVSLLAGSEEFNATKLFEVDTDSCERWMSCKSEFLKKYMHKVINDLPSCPCSYPTEVAYSTADIFDGIKRKDFRWKDASGPKEKLEIYKPTARYCIRSMLSLESTTLAAQHCCYGDNMQLITRGKGAGTPNLISTEFSAELHYKVDILPWIICKGDWSRYNEARPPNNGQKCTESPSDEDYIKQFQEAREY